MLKRASVKEAAKIMGLCAEQCWKHHRHKNYLFNPVSITCEDRSTQIFCPTSVTPLHFLRNPPYVNHISFSAFAFYSRSII
mmetsp:Transcript_6795/g.25359  ORF Transcript_6795/g.25359 Transcript_6795/m.25359 type:complete len:81 (+) Transcript_6795:4236-4478(+)